jgi:hypothetical protein
MTLQRPTHRITLAAGAALLTIAACSSNPTAPAPDPIEARANSTMPPGITLRDFDPARLTGFLKVRRVLANDSLDADTLRRTEVAGYVGDTPDREISLMLKMNGAVIGRDASTHDFFDSSANVMLATGQVAHWELSMSDGSGLTDSILPPVIPEIAAIAQYQTISASGGISADVVGSLNGNALLVVLRYDSSRTHRLLGHGPAQPWHDSATILLRAYDTGHLTLESGVLRTLPSPGVYSLILYRFVYQPGTRSDGKRVGLFAESSYLVPIVVQP